MQKWFNFKEKLEQEGRSANTVKEYVRRVRLWYKYLVDHGQVDIMAATPADVLAYRDGLLKAGQAPRTVNVKVSAVSVYYDYAVQLGLIDRSPVPKGLYIKSKMPRHVRLSDDDLRRFEAWIDTLQPNLRAAFWCLYGSGARVGEVARLRHSDVFMHKGAVYIRIKGAKWGSDRTVPLMRKKAAAVVMEYKLATTVTNRPLFQLSKRTIQTYATAFADKTGIPFHCHLLRHTFATRLVEKGIPITKVQHLLGHKTLTMTYHYTQQANNDLASIAPTITLKKKEKAS